MEAKTKLIATIRLCNYLHSGECHWHDHNRGECQYKDCQESCPRFDGNHKYQKQLWNKRIQAKAAEVFPYETEETCPNALARFIKNQYIDAARVGFVKGYSQGCMDSMPYA